MTTTSGVPRLRFGVFLWLAGMVGVVAINVTVLPQVLREVILPAPLWVILLASFAQSGLLIALAVWAGIKCAPRVGLRALVFEAAATGRPLMIPLRPQLLPGLVAGVAGGILLLAAYRYTPPALAQIQDRFNPPILARILYGGITEEILLRWGFMTMLVWLAWRFLQGRTGDPRSVFVWLAIVVSALLFGAGHLPAASILVGTLSADVVAWVVGVNSAFGVLFGYLFWRHGLEAAMVAHATAHAAHFMASRF